MGLDVVASVVAASLGAVALTRWSTHRNAHRLTNALAKELGMEVGQRSWLGSPHLQGHIEGLEVDISSPLMNYLAVEIRLPRALPEGGWIARRVTPPGPLLPSGDDDLDRRFGSGGQPHAVAAMLHESARATLRSSTVERLSVTNDRIVVDGFWVPLFPRGLPTLVDQLRCAIALAHALPFEGTASERVAENAENDPNPTVRLRNLILVRGEETARMALADPDPMLRVVGAAYLSAFDEIVESDAVRALETTADRTVLEAALAAMEVIGTQRSIQAIRKKRRHIQKLSRRWRETIAAIQERLGSDGEGDLSLLEDVHGGDVSLTD